MNQQTREWNGIAVSVIGMDHVRHERPLQDASAVITAHRSAAVVCDGAGSALMSHVGAQKAVEQFRIAVAAVEPMIADALDDERTPWGFADDLWHYISGWVCRAVVASREECARTGTGVPDDYAFTFAAAVTGKLRTGFIQVGDGAIMTKIKDDGTHLVFKPEKGYFANMTKFLDDKCVENDSYLSRTLPTERIEGLMLMSDGPEVRMIDLATLRPAQVVSDMMADMVSGELDRETLLNYLTDSRWTNNPSGYDDKSIVVLVPKNK